MKKILLVLFVTLMLSGCYYVKPKDRVELKDKIPVSEARAEEIEEQIERMNFEIDDVDVSVEGKVISIDVEYDYGFAKREAKEECEEYIALFSAVEQDYYHFILTLEGDSWIVIATKENDKEEIVFGDEL